MAPVSLFCERVRICKDVRDEMRGGICPEREGFDLRLSCWREELGRSLMGKMIVVGE